MDSIATDVADFKDGAITVSYKAIAFVHEENVVWVELPQPMKPGEATTITIYYHGVPRAAKNPPWDGGWIWKKDAQGSPWMSVACQGLGASVWYPCKDHQSDEPENGANLHITVPDSLQAIGNGRLRSTVKNTDGTSTWNWQVKNPINTYNLVPYIGKYAHFSEVFPGVSGPLDLDYWVLAANEAKAREHFKQVPLMLKCFEQWLGPYPFYDDGYKLVEAPHLGMEHQSSVAYGNNFQNGYLGMDRSGTGRGLKWDYIIIHERGIRHWSAQGYRERPTADRTLWREPGRQRRHVQQGCELHPYDQEHRGRQHLQGDDIGNEPALLSQDHVERGDRGVHDQLQWNNESAAEQEHLRPVLENDQRAGAGVGLAERKSLRALGELRTGVPDARGAINAG
ncbi:MAG: hypothetical protein IPL52_03245 [Flavobacteriales bacterium]|nr:hypothetical protein [Flavobacteriales bacterium]